MASDRQKFHRALDKWNSLHLGNKYSLESGVGRVAILCSYFTDIYGILHSTDVSKHKKQVIDNFRQEANDIKGILKIIGLESTVFYDVKRQDINEVVNDSTYSDVVIIGNGTLTSLFINDKNDNIYDWQDISENSKHLKLGAFIQRQCGNYCLDSIAVPMGLFLMSEHQNIYAAVNKTFNPKTLFDLENKYIKSVTEKSPLLYDEIKLSFNYGRHIAPNS